MIASILVHRNVKEYFSYSIPNALATDISIGSIVNIPLGKTLAQGTVMAIESTNSETELKPVHSIHLELSPIPETLVELIHWISNNYLCSPLTAYQTVIGTKNKVLKRNPKEKKITLKPSVPFELTNSQKNILESIQEKKHFHEWLIHGVTSSGKTEIYTQLALQALNENKQVLILIPEISLTPQFQHIFENRFGDLVGILHSGLTPVQKQRIWHGINKEKIRIVLGPRSSLFSPFKKLGLIVMDEEHEKSYKQDQNPRYESQEVAQFLAKKWKIPLVYGSATPSVELMYRVAQDDPNLSYFSIKERVNKKPLPTITIIDTRNDIQQGNYHLISPTLIEKMKESLAKKEKVMILVNRRGFSPYIACTNCGRVHTCPKCNLSFVYHSSHTFRCHRCAVETPITHTCSFCKKTSLKFSGLGIQKIETELMKMFPDATLIRMDRDTSSTHKKLEENLHHFETEGDILIGTQMIAKGLHFESVSTIGVIGIDTLLNLPDFSSSETAFQMIIQIAGRAGRGNTDGNVYLQTLQKDHYAIQLASQYDFDSFYETEFGFRETLNYPPFKRLIQILFQDKNKPKLVSTAKQVAAFLQNHLADNESIEILGPLACPIEKIQDKYRWQIVLKVPEEQVSNCKKVLALLQTLPIHLRMVIDLHAKQLM